MINRKITYDLPKMYVTEAVPIAAVGDALEILNEVPDLIFASNYADFNFAVKHQFGDKITPLYFRLWRHTQREKDLLEALYAKMGVHLSAQLSPKVSIASQIVFLQAAMQNRKPVCLCFDDCQIACESNLASIRLLAGILNCRLIMLFKEGCSAPVDESLEREPRLKMLFRTDLKKFVKGRIP
jgi:hypothetical protein